MREFQEILKFDHRNKIIMWMHTIFYRSSTPVELNSKQMKHEKESKDVNISLIIYSYALIFDANFE